MYFLFLNHLIDERNNVVIFKINTQEIMLQNDALSSFLTTTALPRKSNGRPPIATPIALNFFASKLLSTVC
jgi:hypothetical protein